MKTKMFKVTCYWTEGVEVFIQAKSKREAIKKAKKKKEEFEMDFYESHEALSNESWRAKTKGKKGG